MSDIHHVGQRLSYDGLVCTVRYIGEVAGTSGSWLGVEWDDASRGKHNGRHKDTQYFECLSTSPVAASFVRPSRPADEPQSFVAALHEKYASELDTEAVSQAQTQNRNPEIEMVYFGKKVAQEVGFDKIRRQLSRVEDLRVVILDGMRIAWDVLFDDGGKGVKETSPLIAELDLSRNLFETFGTVERICRELTELRSLRLNGNRFQLVHEVEEEVPGSARDAFRGVKELELEENLLPWESLCEIASDFPSLQRLSLSLNQLSALPLIDFGSLAVTLTKLEFEFNELTSLADLSPLSSLSALRSLHLKGNSISSITPSLDVPQPTFSSSLTFLDVSYNAVSLWSFVDALPNSLPGLTALRISHNPIYDNTEPDVPASSGQQSGQQIKSSDEAHMMTTARLPNLKTLNFSPISAQERTNAELFYLSRIAKRLCAVPENEESKVLTQHPRYVELCEAYGEPDIVRREEINPSFLEARLIEVHFRFVGDVSAEGEKMDDRARTKTTEIPRSFDVYSVKGIAGRLFRVSPLAVRLVWETGEWDPVGGFDEEVGDSDSDYEDGMEEEAKAEAKRVSEAAAERGEDVEVRKGGQWVKREVELTDGPRQLGFCVDGLKASIRVEMR